MQNIREGHSGIFAVNFQCFLLLKQPYGIGVALEPPLKSSWNARLKGSLVSQKYFSYKDVFLMYCTDSVYFLNPNTVLVEFSLLFTLFEEPFMGSRKIACKENCPPALILTLILSQTLTLTGGQFSSGTIFRTPFYELF